MLRLLQLLIYGYSHEHEWEIWGQCDYAWENDIGERGRGKVFYLKCKHCGFVKQVKYR